MMSLETIRDLSREAARKAARAGKVPFTVEAEDIADLKSKGASAAGKMFPFLGSYVPKGWKRTEREALFFVDSSGFGDPGEPAMTISQFYEALEAGKGYAVIEAGQFQVYVGEFEKVKKSSQLPNVPVTVPPGL